MRIGIVYDSYKEEAKRLALEAVDYLQGKVEEVSAYAEETFLGLDNNIIKTFTEIITFGGDGLVLHIADKIASFEIGMLRVNFGEVGFLTNVELNEIFPELDNFLEGKYKRVERVRIQGTVKRDVVIDEINKEVTGGEVIERFDSLNELVIGGIRKTVFLRMIIDGKESFEVTTKGDGVMFSSWAGSSGYNLNAGGPVLHTDLVFAVTANNGLFSYKVPMPNSKLVNEISFVLETGSKILVQVTKQWKKNMPYLIADSDSEFKLLEGDVVLIERSLQSTIFLEREMREKNWKIS
ncbi:NAD(+)/NADH kinase [Candidatus Parcubacteria bacterium]|nr:NAD(+)/NADH kinase [Candidatus Parcubacteria bacterium]